MFMIQHTINLRGVASLAGQGAHGQVAKDDSNGNLWINLNGTWTQITSGGAALQVAAITNGATVTLQNNAGTTSTGNAGLNSPATLIVSGGALTAVKASA